MKQLTLLLVALCLFLTSARAQTNNVGIGTTTPAASALLDVSSTTKGLLAPRMTQTQRDAIATPATGLLVYQTDNTPGFYTYNGTAWTAVTGSASQLEKITQNSKTGHRILGRNAANYGNIGTDAIDLSLSGSASTTRGATGDYSTAMGYNTTASATFSTAMGYNNTASAFSSTAMGSSNTASAQYSTAMGSSTTASADFSTAMGSSTTASGQSSTAMGQGTKASKDFSTAMGGYTTASGLFSTAMGSSTTASGLYSTAMGFSTTASGQSSTAMGSSTTASGQSSTAMGDNTMASGQNSTAIGSSTTASSLFSTAMGYYTTASGQNSTVMGDNTTAKSYAEVALGAYNTSYTPASTTAFNAADRAFGIGIGASGALKDGLILYKDGTLFLNKLTAAPTTTTDRFYVLNNKLNYNGAEVGSASQLEKITENSKTGHRILGRNAANYGDIGTDAVDLSISTSASTTIGATGDNSTAIGVNSTASGVVATAMGNSTSASGQYSTAMGAFTGASGDYSTAMGYNTTASATLSTAMGYNTVASGQYSTAMGINTTAKSYAEVALGSFNTSYTPLSATAFNAADRAFCVGIGTIATAKDGLIVYKDGTLAFNKLTAAPTTTTDRIYNVSNVLYINGTVVGTQTSDARYKERVEDLPSALANIKKLRPVSYYWKDQKWGAQKEIGFIAQELKTQYPEVVVTDTDGYHKVNYGVLTAVLTKGMQEQQSQIEALGTKNEQLEKENAALKAQLSGFADRLGSIEKALNGGAKTIVNNAEASVKK